MINRTLQDIIEELLARGYEGGFWDYKSDYPDSKEDKLDDIICMSNNLEDRDAYLIYGASDNGTVLGIEKSVKSRYTSASIIQFLRTIPFAGGYIPQVEVHTLQFGEHEVDVLLVLRGTHTPYYLQEEYGKSPQLSNRVRPGAIYTRTSDINTPKDKTASIEHTEYLWRKRFGYDLRPSKRFELLLGEYNGWSDANWDTCRQQFHLDYPEYRIIAGESKDGYNSLSYFYDDERMLYTELKLEYLTTTLYETELWYMDMGRCIIPKPEWKYIIGKGLYYYYLKDSINGLLLCLFSKGKFRCNNRFGQEMPIMVFDNEFERDKFEQWFLDLKQRYVESKRMIIKESAIMQHILEKEAKAGKSEAGVIDIAISFDLYRIWRNEINITIDK